MAITKYKPTSPGRRASTVNDFRELTDRCSGRPEKSLCERIRKTGGRNHHGFITTRHMGGGARRIYRLIDFKRRKDDVGATVDSVQYDPNRSCHIALLHYADGEKRYMLAPLGLKAGDKVESGPRSSYCPPAKCGKFALSAGPRSARSATSSIRTSAGARRGACVTAASGRPSAVPPRTLSPTRWAVVRVVAAVVATR
jgi:hypothetical protein